MTAFDKRRIAALELRSKPKAPRALTEATTRLQTALSEALPGIRFFRSPKLSALDQLAKIRPLCFAAWTRKVSRNLLIC